MNRRHVSIEELRARATAGEFQPQAIESIMPDQGSSIPVHDFFGYCPACGMRECLLLRTPVKRREFIAAAGIEWEWQCPVCENWRTGETCHTCGTSEKESRHHREKR